MATAQIKPETLRRMLTAARDAGIPKIQYDNFVAGQYVPLPWVLPFHAAAREADKSDGPLWIGLGGSRGPGKTHATLAQAGIDDCIRKPGIKALFLRKVKASAAESMEDKAYKILHAANVDITKKEIRIGDSRITIGGFLHTNMILNYLGIEYDLIIIEEATSLTREVITKVRGSLRSTVPGWRARCYLTTNPGGVGHAWFKEHMVMPYRNAIDDHRFIGGKTRFFPATYRDNPFLSQDYVDFLQGLSGSLGLAWREGDWDQFEGMAFPQWNYDTHTVEPFEIPSYWPKWRAVDWGKSAPFACGWYAKDIDTGRVYLYREAYQADLDTVRQAELVKAMTPPEEDIIYTFADPSMWEKRSHEGEWYSRQQEYRDHGVPLIKGDNSRIGGKAKIDTALGLLPDGKPGFQVFTSCKEFIRTVPNLPLDPLKPEDVDTDAEDHHYDQWRYAYTNVKRVKEPPKDRPARRPTIRKSVSKIL